MLRRLCVIGIVVGASYSHAVLNAHEVQSRGNAPAMEQSRSTPAVAPRIGAPSKDASTAALQLAVARRGTAA
jgi:hypothetical protein